MTGRRCVLVTGGAGFIGRPAVQLLRARGFEVFAPSRNEADLLTPGVAAELVNRIRPTHLLHLAWNAIPGHFWTAPDNLDWVAASLMLHRAFASAGGQRAVFAGSCAEYDWSCDRLDETTTPLRPGTLYGLAKHALHSLVQASPEGVQIAWGRVFFLYGPHEPQDRLVPSVVTSLLESKEAACTEGLVERDFMHVDDVAAALVALLESDVTGPVNIASGECIPLRDVILSIAEQIGRTDLVRLGARRSRPDDPPRLAAAIHRLREDVGFSPSRSLREGLADTIIWWRARLSSQAR